MSDKPLRREFVAGLTALAASGCFGKFAATNALYDWNKDVSDSKWLRWLVFLVLIILPVYGLFILADALVINTIEFFSNDNPVNGGHAELPEGHTLTSSRTKDPNVIRHEHRKDGKLVQVIYVRRVSDDELQILNERFEVQARATLAADGAIEVYDADGNLVRRAEPHEQRELGALLERGARPSMALDAAASRTFA